MILVVALRRTVGAPFCPRERIHLPKDAMRRLVTTAVLALSIAVGGAVTAAPSQAAPTAMPMVAAVHAAAIPAGSGTHLAGSSAHNATVAKRGTAAEPSRRRYRTRRRSGVSRFFGFLGFLMCLPLLLVLIVALVFLSRRARRRQDDINRPLR